MATNPNEKIPKALAFRPFSRSLCAQAEKQQQQQQKKKKLGGHYISKKLKLDIIEVFKKVNPDFRFDPQLIPRRTLSFPSEGVHNNGADNENFDLIMRVSDIIQNEQKQEDYEVIDLLGKGTFGQVVKCRKKCSKECFAIKVIKNKPAYFLQAKTEIQILRLLNKHDNHENAKKQRIVRLLDFFVFKSHFCLVFELMDHSLYDLLKSTQFTGFGFKAIAYWTKQILEGMIIAEKHRIIHCDLKPENIMLLGDNLRIIDFGSACNENSKIYSYIQSRFYRAPEIILGIPYTIAIDMWSLGCIVVELYLGLPIFPGNSPYDQIWRIVNILGMPKETLIQEGRTWSKYFKFNSDISQYQMKSKEEYERDIKGELKESKNYYQLSSLQDLKVYLNASQIRKSEVDEKNLEQYFDLFIDLVSQLLLMDPKQRISASKALEHPFIKLSQEISEFDSTLDMQSRGSSQSPSEERKRNSSGKQSTSLPKDLDFSKFQVSQQNSKMTKMNQEKKQSNGESPPGQATKFKKTFYGKQKKFKSLQDASNFNINSDPFIFNPQQDFLPFINPQQQQQLQGTTQMPLPSNINQQQIQQQQYQIPANLHNNQQQQIFLQQQQQQVQQSQQPHHYQSKHKGKYNSKHQIQQQYTQTQQQYQQNQQPNYHHKKKDQQQPHQSQQQYYFQQQQLPGNHQQQQFQPYNNENQTYLFPPSPSQGQPQSGEQYQYLQQQQQALNHQFANNSAYLQQQQLNFSNYPLFPPQQQAQTQMQQQQQHPPQQYNPFLSQMYIPGNSCTEKQQFQSSQANNGDGCELYASMQQQQQQCAQINFQYQNQFDGSQQQSQMNFYGNKYADQKRSMRRYNSDNQFNKYQYSEQFQPQDPIIQAPFIVINNFAMEGSVANNNAFNNGQGPLQYQQQQNLQPQLQQPLQPQQIVKQNIAPSYSLVPQQYKNNNNNTKYPYIQFSKSPINELNTPINESPCQ